MSVRLVIIKACVMYVLSFYDSINLLIYLPNQSILSTQILHGGSAGLSEQTRGPYFSEENSTDE